MCLMFSNAAARQQQCHLSGFEYSSRADLVNEEERCAVMITGSAAMMPLGTVYKGDPTSLRRFLSSESSIRSSYRIRVGTGW
jgi:hypothetical protein